MAWITDNFGFDLDSEITYQKASINQLSSELSQIVICGIIIAKQDIRRIASLKKPGSERYVLNFTVRDSPADTINAACWGEEAAIETLSASFTIGDVVQIKNPQIIERQNESSDEKFRPVTKSRYQLNISPLYSEISVCTSQEKDGYVSLLHCPLHLSSDTNSLADIVHNSQSAEGLTVNLIVAVKDVGYLQTLKTKDGREVKKLLLTVFDQTHPNFSVLIWEKETANFISKYCVRRSVLFISGIKVNYSSFMKETVGNAGSTTVFTPEPEIPDARVLYQYAMKVALPNDNEQKKHVQLDSSAVYNIEDIIKIMNSAEMAKNEIQGYVIALVSTFDIDGTDKIYSYRCPGCLQKLEKKDDRCTEGTCEVGSGMRNLPAEEILNYW